jgi:hypothetical protein
MESGVVRKRGMPGSVQAMAWMPACSSRRGGTPAAAAATPVADGLGADSDIDMGQTSSEEEVDEDGSAACAESQAARAQDLRLRGLEAERAPPSRESAALTTVAKAALIAEALMQLMGLDLLPLRLLSRRDREPLLPGRRAAAPMDDDLLHQEDQQAPATGACV